MPTEDKAEARSLLRSRRQPRRIRQTRIVSSHRGHAGMAGLARLRAASSTKLWLLAARATRTYGVVLVRREFSLDARRGLRGTSLALVCLPFRARCESSARRGSV